MVVHTMVTPGSEQMHAFNLGGLRFMMDSRIVDGNTAETRGLGPWEYSTSKLLDGAGGGRPGDYFYGDMRRVFTKAGMWGLQRVLPQPLTCPTDGVELRCLDTAAGTP
jgi:hypothetical protein